MSTVLKIKSVPKPKVIDRGYAKETLMGAQGHKGLTGDTGPAGVGGTPGASGSAGPKGDTGFSGKNGLQGPTGINGQMGLTGPQGERGPMPLHEYRGDAIRFEIATGVWGKWIKLSDGNSHPQNLSLGSMTASTVIDLIEQLGGGVDYNVLIDTVNSYKYIGSSVPGSATSAALWKIKRIDLTDSGGDIPILWANGSAELTQVWDDRLTQTYSATGA